MTFTEEFAQAWRRQRVLMKQRPDRLRIRLLIYLIWALAFGLFFAAVHGIQAGRFGSLAWWRDDVPGHLLVSASVTTCFAVAFRGLERLAP